MSETGQLVFVDVGMGAFVLHTADGRRVAVLGHVPRQLVGQQVRVQGEVAPPHTSAMVHADSVLIAQRVEAV